MNKKQIIKEGYIAFNGYMFNKYDAENYNRACNDINTTDDQRHRLFCVIIGVYN